MVVMDIHSEEGQRLLRMVNRQIGNNEALVGELRRLRKRQGMSQEDIGIHMGVTQPAVSAIESCNADPRLATLGRYATALDCIIEFRVVPYRDRKDAASADAETGVGSVRA